MASMSVNSAKLYKAHKFNLGACTTYTLVTVKQNINYTSASWSATHSPHNYWTRSIPAIIMFILHGTLAGQWRRCGQKIKGHTEKGRAHPH